MGGDRAPSATVAGALRAAADLGLGLALVGPRAVVDAELARHEVGGLELVVIDAPDVIGMDEAPAAALRRKQRSSVRVALETVASGEAQACFTAGHTGAAVIGAHAVFGMVSGVDRPALAAMLPTRRGFAVLLDAGANAECRPSHLVQFAAMGRVFARIALGIAEPRVAILSIGEESSKGNDLTREAHRQLKATTPGFVGNVEARDVFGGTVDVIVCDGFTGNVALKVSEGLVETLEELLTAELARSLRSRLGFWLSRPALGRLRRRIDDAEYGGAPLIGVAGLCVVGHGRSSARAVRNGIALASRFVREDFLGRLAAEIDRQASADRNVAAAGP
jgi:glycerol-3-phosphate acyltransferase PlsX